MPLGVNRVAGAELAAQFDEVGVPSPEQRLSEAFPAYFARYCEHFIDFFPRTPYHTKTSYEFGWPQKKRRGSETSLALIDTDKWKHRTSTVERHLDQDHWLEYHEVNGLRTGKLTEFFWLAQNMPKKVSFHAIDADSKNCIAWIGDGTPDRPALPVMEMSKTHFANLKAIYDAFPNRIWCITSQTLGLDIIERHQLLPATEVHARTKRRLARIGLGHIEVHPMSGRCKRRPFGEHYQTITADGVLTTWQNQLDYFEHPGATPSFRHICLTLLTQLQDQWQHWLSDRNNRRNRKIDVPAEVARLRGVARSISQWLDDGCPPDSHISVAVPSTDAVENEAPDTSSKAQEFDYSELRGGRWATTLEKIARNGLPAEDSLGPIVFELAKWLWWVELHGVPESDRHDQIVELLRHFVTQKHNGRSSRINSGQWEDVYGQVQRCVVSASSLNVPSPNRSKQLFESIRNKRASNKYSRLIKIVPLLRGSQTHKANPDSPTSSLLSTLFSVTTFEDKLKTPLPEALLEMIRPHAGKKKLNGFVTTFLNLLYYAQNDNSIIRLRRQELWDRKLIPKNPKRWQAIVETLKKAGVIDTDTYRAHTRPTGFRLRDGARRLMDDQRSSVDDSQL